MFIYMCAVCMCMCVYAFIYLYMCIYVYVYICIYRYMYVCLGIIEEFNLGVGSHVSITLWYKFCSWDVWDGGKPTAPYLAIICITFRFAYMKYDFCWQLILILLYFKLGMQTNYPFTQTFFFHTIAAAFPTSCCLKTVYSCWVWKFSNDACPLSIMYFIIQSVSTAASHS